MPFHLQRQQPCKSLHESQSQRLHGRSLPLAKITRSDRSLQYNHISTNLYSTGPGTNDTNLDNIIDVLKDAFSTHTPARRKPQAMSESSSVPSFANPSRRSSSMSSSSAAKPVKDKGGSRGDVQAAAAAPAVSPKKRKGPFADLIASLEHEVQNVPTDSSTRNNTDSSSSSSTSTSSSSTTSNSTDSSTARASLGSSSSSNSSSSSGTSATASSSSNSSSSPRKMMRRINRQVGGSTADQEQQQQQPQRQQQQPAPQPQQQPPWMQQAAADAARGKKQYKPVYKGDLALPGGPGWSALRRHLVAAGTDASLPTLHSIIIVEGDQDQRAVARAVNAPVYVCDGTRVLKPHVKPELAMLQQLGRPLIVLTDPDERGRELRVHLDSNLGPVLHSFVPEPYAAALVDGPVHGAGNRGIEHVVPTGVQQALAAARSSYPADRQVWSMARLQELQLVNAFDDGASAATGPGGAADRRRQLCALLGLGRCNGGQLLSMLNRFFDEATVEAALKQLGPVPVA